MGGRTAPVIGGPYDARHGRRVRRSSRAAYITLVIGGPYTPLHERPARRPSWAARPTLRHNRPVRRLSSAARTTVVMSSRTAPVIGGPYDARHEQPVRRSSSSVSASERTTSRRARKSVTDGIRTRDLRRARRAPYPLGHSSVTAVWRTLPTKTSGREHIRIRRGTLEGRTTPGFALENVGGNS